jgi:ribose transport system ATP-binding protein
LIIDRKAELFSNQDFIRKLNIKLHNLNNSILSLSGGNQQKVILAKTLSSKPNILILDNPTQGVDIAAKFEIYNIIVKLAESGVGIVILSNEPQEILSLCDRIYVMYQGKIRKEFNRDEASQKKIMIIATGGAL